MTTQLRLHEATIRPSLVAELEAFRSPGQRVSSYYLDFRGSDAEAAKLAVKNPLALQQERLDQLDVPTADAQRELLALIAQRQNDRRSEGLNPANATVVALSHLHSWRAWESIVFWEERRCTNSSMASTSL